MSDFGIYLVFLLPALLLGLYAQMRLSSTYSHYINQPISTGVSGAEAARRVLDAAGLNNLPIREIPGQLTDHYDPIRKELCLSSDNYHGRTVAAVGVAAHEAGHALQHKAAYVWLNLRMALVPITGIASTGATFLFILGIFLSITKLALLGVIAYGVITLFQIITLPVEFDASRRAKLELERLGIVRSQEAPGVRKVLNAAAMTYVAAMVQSVSTLLYFLMLASGNRRS